MIVNENEQVLEAGVLGTHERSRDVSVDGPACDGGATVGPSACKCGRSVGSDGRKIAQASRPCVETRVHASGRIPRRHDTNVVMSTGGVNSEATRAGGASAGRGRTVIARDHSPFVQAASALERKNKATALWCGWR
eukprot:3519554-Pleurochrysis_carterae.AAC.2